MPSWIVAQPVDYMDSDGVLTVTAVEKSDFWRKTHYGFIHDDGHLYAEPLDGDFTLSVTFTGNYRNEYDHAGLMLWQDETTWVKTGIEFTEGRYFMSAVVTRDFSDWSVAVLPEDFGGALRISLKRMGADIEIRYQFPGAEGWTLFRIAPFSSAATLQGGRMLGAPSGAGFRAIFTDYTITRG